MTISIPLALLLAAGAAQPQPAPPPVTVTVTVPQQASPPPPPPASPPVVVVPPAPKPPLVVPVALAPGPSVQIVHRPPSETAAGLPLTLTAKVENGHLLDAFELHYRQRGGAWSTVPFGKDAQGGFAAIVAAKEVKPPSLEYYISAREEQRPERDRFASAAAPHPVLVKGDPEEQERQTRLAWHRGNTSSAQATAEYVSFGGVRGNYDRYYQVEASYQYRILGPIEHIQLGVGTLRGDVPPPTAFGPILALDPGRHTGLDYGYGELAFNLTEQVGFTGRLFLGADELGFATGASGVLRIGRETFAHVELGGQFIQRVGYDASLRLAWDTVPRWPIGFAVHITNAPSAPVKAGSTPDNPLTDEGAPTGIRALLDAGYQLSGNVTLLFKAGYQARFSTAGGVSLGAGARVEW